VGIVADENSPMAGLDALEDDLCRRLVAEDARAVECDLLDIVIDIGAVSMPMPVRRCRVDRISIGLSCSDSVPLWILPELDTIEVPMWPGITTEHLMWGALSRRSVISASVKPFTANLAAL
jgi:hypothetical protein